VPFTAAAEAELAQLSALGSEPAFLSSLRTEGAGWFRQHGLPGRSDEAWRYTPTANIAEVPFAPAPQVEVRNLDARLAPSGFGCEPAQRALLVNGRCALGHQARDGVELRSLAAAMREEPASIEPYLGRLGAPAHAFAALNTALFRDGIVLRVSPGVAAELPVHLGVVEVAHGRPAVDYPRLLVILGAGSTLSLVEWHLELGDGRFLSASVTEVVLGPGASLEHTRIALGTELAHRVGVVAVSQAERSRYHSRVFTSGARLARLDLGVRLDGEGASCSLEGLYYVRGTEYVDHHTTLDHRAAGASSQQTYRGMVDEWGRAVFDGTVFVRRGAQRTAAHQQNHHLLLSDQAVVDTKPRLEIDADDVQCGHGASVGKLDAEQLFYLRSRGLPLPVARAWLVRAFAEDILGRVPSAAVRATLEQALASRLGSLDQPGGAA
jgi:Fe-S cluster assembly protein SufD